MPTLSWYPLHLTEQILEGSRTFADICDRAAAWKIGAVELYDGLLSPLGPLAPAAARQMLDAAGVRTALLLCAQDFASPLLAERQEQKAVAERYLDAAGALGAAGVRVTPGITHPGITRADALGLAVENVADLAARAAERGLTCCVENTIHDSRWHAADISAPAASFRDLLRRLEDAPVQVLLNTGNPPLVMADTLDLLAAVPEDRLYGIHLSERATVDGAHIPLGDGPVPWDAVKQALKARGFDGPVGIVDGQTLGDGGSLRSLQFAREWLADW